jgi:hypothetical protein
MVKFVPSNLFSPSLVPIHIKPVRSFQITLTVLEDNPSLVVRVVKLRSCCANTRQHLQHRNSKKNNALPVMGVFDIMKLNIRMVRQLYILLKRTAIALIKL